MKRSDSYGRTLAGLALALSLGSCGGGGDPTPTPTPPANARPAVLASAPSPSVTGSSITLFGSATDPEGDPLTFAWSLETAAPGSTVLIDSPAAATTTLSGIIPAGTYLFRFTASDASGSVHADVSLVVVDPVPQPRMELFVADRQAIPLGATAQISKPFRGSPVTYAPPLAVPVYEGGWSGLGRVRNAAGSAVDDEFWVINDRGPNYSISARVPPAPPGATAFGSGAKLFPIPGYAQKILRVKIDRPSRSTQVLSVTSIRSRGIGATPNTVGVPSSVAGLSTAETAYSNLDDKASLVSTSPVGLDFEGIVEDRITIAGVDRRVFWTCDEYGPSIQMIEADQASPDFGKVLREYIPGATADVPNGLFALPALLRQRRDNRGFEGVAATPRAVWGMVQSNLKASFGSATSRLHRFVRVDKATGAVTMYGYDHVQTPEAVGSSHGGVKIGDMVAVSEGEFLVLEHDGDLYAHVYRVRVRPTTTVLHESENGNYEKGLTAYVPVEKTLVADLTPFIVSSYLPTKPEGMVLVDPTTLALTFDNDYGMDSDDTNTFMTDGDRARNLVALLHLPQPVVPSLRFVAEFNTGLGAAIAEIVSVEASTGRGFVTAEADGSVQVFDVADPAKPAFLRRDPVAAAGITSVAAHPTYGYYLVAAQRRTADGHDAVEVHRSSDGLLLRVIDLGVGVGPDSVQISPNGRFAVVCNEAEDPWMPGSIVTLDLGAGPFADAATAATSIAAPNVIALSGLVPATGAFSTRWIDRIYNAAPAGVTITTANGAVTLDPNLRMTDSGGNVADQTDVTFTVAGTPYACKYRFDGAVSGGSDGNTFLFQLNSTANMMEPEYAAFDATSATCVVTLQENNAVAVIDMTLPTPAIRAVNGVFGLGQVNVANADTVNGAAGTPASFKDLLQREREPDGISLTTIDGVAVFLTADEGDTFAVAPTDSSNSRTKGGRTISVFRLSDGALLGDTGNQVDAVANAAGRWGAFVESSRARRGGSEPEGVETIALDGRVLAVVGLERANAIELLDVTDASKPTVIDVAGIGGLAGSARLGPEGLKILTVGTRVYVLVAFEVSGVVGIFEIVR